MTKGIIITDRWKGATSGVGSRWQIRVRDPQTRRYESATYSDKAEGIAWAIFRRRDFLGERDTAVPASFAYWGGRYLEDVRQRAFTARYVRQVEVAIQRITACGIDDMRDDAFPMAVRRIISDLKGARKGGIMPRRGTEALERLRRRPVVSGNPASASTKNFHITIGKAVCEWARMHRAINYNALDMLRPYKVMTEARRIFAVTELRRLLDPKGAQDPWHMLIALMVYTGTRPTEARHITWAMLDWATGVFHLPAVIAGNKTKIARSIPLQQELRAILQPILRVGSVPIVSQRIHDLDAGSASRGFQDYCKRIGLDAAGRTPHNLRHTFCALMTAMDINIFVTMSIVGHGEPVTARRYSQRALELRPQVAGWPRGDFHIMRDTHQSAEIILTPQELELIKMFRAKQTG